MTAAPRFDAVRKEQKSERLEAFILRCMAAERAAVGDLVVSVLARDADSPVVKALFARAALDADLRIDILFTSGGLDGSPEVLLERVPDRSRCHVSPDPRLRDAHEMLLIGGEAVWMGDCMRRDPLRCDSYELYSGSCARTAARFRLFFERLWRAADEPRRQDLERVQSNENRVPFPAAVTAAAAPLPAAPTLH